MLEELLLGGGGRRGVSYYVIPVQGSKFDEEGKRGGRRTRRTVRPFDFVYRRFSKRWKMISGSGQIQSSM